MRENPLARALFATMVVVVVTGLVDSPYIKNDLSVFFWGLVAMMYVEQKKMP